MDSVEKLSHKFESKEGKKWSEPEKFVWKQLCEEEVEVADLSNRSEKEKVLTFKFLKAILLDKQYNEELPTRIRIKGAVFNDKIDFISENISQEVSLTNSKFMKIVDLSNSTFSKSVNFENSKFNQGLVFKDAIVKGSLSFKNATFSN